MKIVQLNATCGIGSTGRICVSISKLLSAKGVDNIILYSLRNSSYKLSEKFTNELIRKGQSLGEKVCGNFGLGSYFSTYKLIKKLKRIKPDIVHIHNIHNRDCNVVLLFNYLRRTNIRVFWTFHDCWAFTGYCTHYDLIGCTKWKKQCICCPQYKHYSFFFDRSNYLFNKKRTAYSKGLNLTIVTPSNWLANQVSHSFLNDYNTKVIRNGIDLSMFKPTNSDLRKRYNCNNQFIVLGVSLNWDYKKGLDVFNYLAERLGPNYLVVLIGSCHEKEVKGNILRIERTNSLNELVKWYSASDVLVNASREENYPTVNLESLACGTPVVTFDSGGSPESITQGCGIVVPRDDKLSMLKAVRDVCENNLCDKDSCVRSAILFDENLCFDDYLKLYGL